MNRSDVKTMLETSLLSAGQGLSRRTRPRRQGDRRLQGHQIAASNLALFRETSDAVAIVHAHVQRRRCRSRSDQRAAGDVAQNDDAADYETSVDPGRQLAKTRYLCLQGAYDLRPIYNSGIVTSPALSGLRGPDGYTCSSTPTSLTRALWLSCRARKVRNGRSG